MKAVLIANRGEIAVRIARACQERGLRTIAVYSTEDRGSAVTRMADVAVHIGPGPSRRSYLNIPAIIEAARLTGADAIHPGCGFLSEDPDFAEVCAAEGFTFVGPPPAVMARLGDKASARELMTRVGLPLLPGSPGT
ncbi:MAG: biotin carboxylase N-terminal domain-containing protein, partial [Frankia sp.]